MCFFSLSGQTLIQSFPYVQDFDGPGFVPDNQNSNPGQPTITLAEGWSNATADDPQDWAIRSIATGSSNTGPSQDHTGNNGNYLYVEDGYGNYPSIVLLSPWFDLSLLSCPVASFYIHHQSNIQPSNLLSFELEDSSGWQQNIIPVQYGDTSSAWKRVQIDLRPYQGQTIRLGFRVSNDQTGFQNDIALDDFTLDEGNWPELILEDLFLPLSACDLGVVEEFDLSLRNTGCIPLDSLVFGVYLDSQLVGRDTLFTTLLPQSKLDFTHTTSLNLSTPGIYTVEVKAEMNGMALSGTLSTKKEVESLSPPTPPTLLGDTICPLEPATLTHAGSERLIWSTANGQILAWDSSFQTPSLPNGGTYFAQSVDFEAREIGKTGVKSFAPGRYFLQFTSQGKVLLDKLGLYFSQYDSAEVSIYLSPGGYMGKTSDSLAWTLFHQASVLGAGPTQVVELALPLAIWEASTTMGMMIVSNKPLAYHDDLFSAEQAFLYMQGGPRKGQAWQDSLLLEESWTGILSYQEWRCASSPQPVSITLYPEAMLDWPTDTLFCQGDSIFLDAGTGTQFLWGDGVTQHARWISQTGTYSVQKSGLMGCFVMDSIQVSNPPPILVSTDSMFSASCPNSEDGMIFVSADGGLLPLSFQWQHGDSSLVISGLNAGYYSLLVSDAAGCKTSVDSLYLPSQDSLPEAAFSFSLDQTQVQLENLSNGASSYQWDFGDGTAFSHESSPSHTYATPGLYTIQLIVSNACGSDTIEEIIDLTTVSISSLQAHDLRLQYVPQDQALHLTARGLPGRYIEVSVTDLSGKQMYLASFSLKEAEALEKKISTPWPKGIYILRLGNREGQWSQKFQID
ncbi:MAG: PKD domain-containing protein [Bacteroidota bacterium]